MFPPWHKLKQCEMAAMRIREHCALDHVTIASLRWLFDQCKNAPDADENICYHGARALIAEFDGELEVAIEHRRIEIQKIGQLHELARRNEGDRPALVNYGDRELEHRKRILDELVAKLAY